MKPTVITLARTLLAALLLAVPMSAAACEHPAFELLTRLVGHWEVSKDGQPVGELRMRASAGGCALVEEWQAADGRRAAGLHWPEPARNDEGETVTVLRQVYVDSTGWSIHAEGRLAAEDVLVYEGETTRDDQTVHLRATMHGLGSDRIVHINDVSTDGGATWRRVSTFHYRRIGD